MVDFLQNEFLKKFTLRTRHEQENKRPNSAKVGRLRSSLHHLLAGSAWLPVKRFDASFFSFWT